MTKDQTYYLDEALYISAKAPSPDEINSVGNGGGGPGSGGWGLTTGPHRGTSPSKHDIARVITLRRVLTEEYQNIEKEHKDKYAAQITQLPKTIIELKAQIKKTSESSTNTSKTQAWQQALTSQINQIRASYLKILPDAHSYYGVPAFYKRGDSMMSRYLEPGFFTVKGEALGREYISRLQKSWDGSHRLHLEALKHQALADELQGIAIQVDQEETKKQPLDLEKAANRRTAQIIVERQVYFDCLPSVLQHELSNNTTIGESFTLVQTLNAYLTTAANLVKAKQSKIPSVVKKNPEINGPLSKPQLEALLNLVDEQRLRRAGPRWKEYHQALSLTESIRVLGVYSAGTQNLAQRAVEVERLLAQHAAQQEAARQLAEAKRLAAEEAARKKAEAERLAAEEARQRQELARQSISYINEGRFAASVPTIVPIGAATFAIAETASAALSAAISATVSRLATAALASAGPAIVGVLSAAWPSTLGNAERHFLISTPLSSLSPPGGPDLAALALSSASVDLPYLLAGSEDENGLGLYVVPGGKPVAVRAAAFDAQRQVYSLALDNPQRILTWTPARAPGSEEGSSTSLPPAPPGTVVYTGSSLNPVSSEPESYPALDLLDQERLIIKFPIDSGLPPILVVFKSPRYEPGTATGFGAQVTGLWLGEATREEGAPIPAHIADLLRGREFRSFDAFRMQFWKAVANDPELSKQFDERNLRRMKKKGNAPAVDDSDIYMSHLTFVLHHTIPINDGGGVYDMNNLKIVTPSAHNKIHYGKKQ